MNSCYGERTHLQEEKDHSSGGLVTVYRCERARYRKSVTLFDLLMTLFSKAAKLSVRRILRVTAIVVCLFAFLGVIGGVEAELISVGVGIVLSCFLLFVEILCLKGSLS